MLAIFKNSQVVLGLGIIESSRYMTYFQVHRKGNGTQGTLQCPIELAQHLLSVQFPCIVDQYSNLPLSLKSEGEIKGLNTNSISSVEGFLSEKICIKIGENSWILKDYLFYQC